MGAGTEDTDGEEEAMAPAAVESDKAVDGGTDSPLVDAVEDIDVRSSDADAEPVVVDLTESGTPSRRFYANLSDL